LSFDFDAGRYALFLWPAFAVTAAAFVWMVADTVLRTRRWRREAERRAAERDADGADRR
jgi:heme exporter protein D